MYKNSILYRFCKNYPENLYKITQTPTFEKQRYR